MLTAHYDYLCFTLHDDDQVHECIQWFQFNFIDAVWSGFGGYGYKDFLVSRMTGARLYCYPSIGQSHCHCQLTSKSLTFLTFDKTLEFLGGRNYSIRRADVAIDGINLDPETAYSLVLSGCVRCRSNRRTLTLIQNPEAEREDGVIGTATMYFGSRESERYLRIYNLHGFNRLELELRGDTADHVFKSVDYKKNLLVQFIGIVRDYIDFYQKPYEKEKGTDNTLHSDWIDKLADKAGIKYYQVLEDTTVEQAKMWLKTQASAWLAVMADIEPGFIQDCIEHAKLKEKHKRVMKYFGS